MSRSVITICPYCGVGCGIEVTIDDAGKIIGFEGFKGHPVSHGHLCGKGASSIKLLDTTDRLLYPMKRVNGEFIRISWNEAISEIVHKMKEIREKYGPEALAFYGGCRNTLEEVYLFQKLARALGTNNVDSCARLCHDPSAKALKDMLGYGGSANSVNEIPKARVVVITGESITDSHPVLSQYLIEAKRNGTKIIVIDPRTTATAKMADLHLRPIPSTEVYLFNAVANYLINNELIDRDFIINRTENFEEYARVVSKYTIEDAEKITGVPKGLILRFAQSIATKPVLFTWGLGMSESSGVDGIKSYIALALLTGNMGIEGGGVIVYRGQTNVQGSGDFLKPDVFPGGLPINEESARKLAEVWGFMPPIKPGISLIDAVYNEDSGIRGMYLMGFNIVASLPNRRRVEEFLSNLDLLVVQDIAMSETAEFAHYVLPAALWIEREGSVLSLDRLVKWRHKVRDPPGEAKPDLEIIFELANAFGLKGFSNDPKVIFNEMRQVVPIMRSVTLEDVMDPTKDSRVPENTPHLYSEKFLTPSGKARFFGVEYRPVNTGGKRFILVTGRSVLRYNTDNEIRRISGKFETSVVINPEDAMTLGISNGQLVRLVSNCGEGVFKALISNDVPRGVIFAYMHDSRINYVVCTEFDPYVKTPRYKVTPVDILPI